MWVQRARDPRRRGIPLAAAVGFLLLSGAVNFGVVRGAVLLFKSEPWEDTSEELLIVDLTDPGELETEELEDEPEPELEEQPNPEREFELIEPEPEQQPAPEPEPEPEPERPPEEEPAPAEVPVELEPIPANMKMVEQLDEFDDAETNKNADFLSNIDRAVVEQTQAEITNLARDALEAEASQLEPSELAERGTASEDAIAQAQDQRSADQRKAPDVEPEREDMRPEQDDPEKKSLLATRELEALEHSEAMEAVEDLALEAADGVVAAAQERSSSVLARDQQAKITSRDPRYQFKLSHDEMDAVFGHDHRAPVNTESLKMSKNEGMWDDARKAYQSPLENFVPEVKTGNQTALNSRKHPFARYITAMHRGIHQAWGFGYLEALDNSGSSHPLNDMGLWTKVEIVLAKDGTVEKVKTVHHSGNSSFDAAAREVVFSTGPYPNPPKSIRSGNGKIYIHWSFHRNERACGTFGAQPFILDNAGQGEIPDVHGEVHLDGRAGGEIEGPRVMARTRGGSALEAARGEQTEELYRGSVEPPKAAGPGTTVTTPGGQGRGGMGGTGRTGVGSGAPGFGTAKSGQGQGQGQGQGHGGTGSSVPRPSVPRPTVGGTGTGTGAGMASKSGRSGGLLSGARAESKPVSERPAADPSGETDAVATAIAKNWVRAFAKGEVATMVNRSAVPFRSGATVAAKNKDELSALLEALADEVAGKKIKHEGTYTAAALRKKFGSVPSGIQEGEERLYAVFEIGGDSVILMLKKRYGSWRVVGITR